MPPRSRASLRRSAILPAVVARSCTSSPTGRCGITARSTRWCGGCRTSRSPIAACALIAVALYQLEHAKAPPFAVVDQAVAAAAEIARPAAKGLVNALLRRFLREREALLEAVESEPVGRVVASALVDLSRAHRLAAALGIDSRGGQSAAAAFAARQPRAHVARSPARRFAQRDVGDAPRARRHRRRRAASGERVSGI